MTNVLSAITPAAGHPALGQPANREEGPLQSPSNALLIAWTQSVAARDQSQRAVNPRSNDAKKFCALGALTKASHEQGLSDRWLVELFNLLTLSQVIPANDCKAILASWPFSISSKRRCERQVCRGACALPRSGLVQDS